ncbi:MAG: heptosyltransferase [Pseudomonadota bacterium]|nr:heptosyltransferase [Pseudomonadota bacterium]
MYNILIVRLSSLGDIIHTYPMIYDIKVNFPNCTIDWLVDDSFADLVKLNPLINKVISVPLRQWKKNRFNLLKHLKNIKQWRKDIICKRYDYIIDSQGLLKSAILARCFNGSVYGLGRNSIREKIASLLYHHKYEIGKNILAVTKNRLLAAAIYNYSINTEIVNFGMNEVFYTTNYDNLNSNLKKLNTTPYVIFFHATSKDSKKLSAQSWVDLAKYLIEEYKLTIVLPYGSITEKSESINIKNMLNSQNILVPDNKLNFETISHLISKAEFIFGVDTGLIHLANALNKKVIAIYVDTNPEKTGIFESNIAKNIGNIDVYPNVNQLIKLYETIIRYT